MDSGAWISFLVFRTSFIGAACVFTRIPFPIAYDGRAQKDNNNHFHICKYDV